VDLNLSSIPRKATLKALQSVGNKIFNSLLLFPNSI